jgi:hypothetical protein
MDTLKSILSRIVAVIAAESLGVIGAGSLVGIEVWQAAVLAGALGCSTSIRSSSSILSSRWPTLSAEEINEAFAKVDKKAN